MSLLHQIALIMAPGVGAITARMLVERFGSAEAVFEAKASELRAAQGSSAKLYSALHLPTNFERAQRELHFIERYHINTCFINSDIYPQRLRACADAPVLLFYKGNVNMNARRVVSIVGTRKSTEYGRELTISLVRALHMEGVVVVSGLAYGIDSIAHRECLSEGIPTVGVVGHGLDRIYPQQHRGIAERMLEQGAVVSEFVSGTLPDRENFPRRNRIVAGMADATIIVEAALNGGALITAELANSYDRDVFAYPGRVNDVYSEGCNKLIKENKAHLVSSAADIRYIMGWEEDLKGTGAQTSMFGQDLNESELLILQTLQEKGELAIDMLAVTTRIPQSKLAMMLLNLEIGGYILTLPGPRYKKII